MEELEGRLPEPIEEALIPAAFIESHRAEFNKAQKQLADRLQQEEIIKQRDNLKALAKSAIDDIKSLNDTQASILRNKAALEAERNRLLQELNWVNQAIDIADHNLLRFHRPLPNSRRISKSMLVKHINFTRVCGRFLVHQ